MSTHLTDESLILHYYGELAGLDQAEAGAHLGVCATCRTEYARLQRVLAAVDAVPAPARAPDYEADVWARLQRRLPARRHAWWMPRAWAPAARWAMAGGLAGVLLAAFVAARFWPAPAPPGRVATVGGADPRERILLLAVGDHLEQTQMVLIELVNAEGADPVDISAARSQAADLVSDNRLYRRTAEGVGDARIADVLDELERVLIEVARSPSEVSRQDLQAIVDSIDAGGLLFKVRIVGQEVREREEAAVAPLGRAVS